VQEIIKKPFYKRAAPRRLTVKSAYDVSPSLRCVCLTGIGLKDFPIDCHGAHIKVFIAKPHQHELTLPDMGETKPIWPGDDKKPFVRTYSVRRFRPDLNELDIEFVNHGTEGPASHFALTAKPGDEVGVSSPFGPHPMLPPGNPYMIAGDLSALPAMAALLEQLPSTAQGYAYILANTAEDIRPLSQPKGVQITWFTGDDADSFITAFKAQASASPQHFFWIAGEEKMVIQLRAFLYGDLSIDKQSTYALPYWRSGLDDDQYDSLRHS